MDKPDYNLSNKHQMQRQVDSFAAQTLPGAYRRTHRRQSKNPKRDRGDISFHRLYVEKRVRNVWILQGLDCWEVEKRAKFRVTEGQLWALCVLFLLVSRERSNQATWEKTSVWGVLQHLGWGRISCSGRIMKAPLLEHTLSDKYGHGCERRLIRGDCWAWSVNSPEVQD